MPKFKPYNYNQTSMVPFLEIPLVLVGLVKSIKNYANYFNAFI
ncbi:MAG: hypothetical protein ACI82Z_001701 [Cellvibrionaceae bacterium]|jgi:hypothetical protein